MKKIIYYLITTTFLLNIQGVLGQAVLVKDILPGAPPSSPDYLTNVNGTLFFSASNGFSVNGRELWKSDGTVGGTVMVKDIRVGTGDSNPLHLTDVNGVLFFAAYDGLTADYALWKSDGTSGGTVMVKDIGTISSLSTVANFTNVNGILFFTANDGVNGTELWKSDGTTTGTVMVKDINSGASGSFPEKFTDVNGTLFFWADNGTNGTELWKSDGTALGTVMIKDINPGAASSMGGSFRNYININGTYFFCARDATNGLELWKSDGTEIGTTMITNNFGDFSCYFFCDLNGILFFNGASFGDQELWKSDGTNLGTVLVKNINVSGGSAPVALTNVNGTLFFRADDGINGNELWKSDGTALGTVLVKDINSGIVTSNLDNLTNVNGTLFFSASNGVGVSGNELWQSDGTTLGTVFQDIQLGSGSSNPQKLINVNGTLFFSADDGINGTELWKYTIPVPTWTGNTNTNWNETTNWNTGIVPTASDNVIIPDVSIGNGGSGNFPAVNTTASVTNITIDANATLTINTTQSLTVSGILTNNGTITIESGGALVQEDGSTLAGSGTYIVEREIGAGQRFIGSPINNHSVSGFGISPSGSNGGQIIPVTNPIYRCNNDSIDATSPYGNIMELIENAAVIDNCAQSLWHVKSTGNLTNARGYAVNVAANTTLTFTGTVNNDDRNYGTLGRQAGTLDQWNGNGTTTRGWHLVSNPYPSPITFTNGSLGADFDNQIQLFDGSSFIPFTLSGGPVTVAVGQGFQIRVATEGGSGTFSVNNAMRVAGNPTFYRQQSPFSQYVDITLSNTQYSDKSTIYFEADATSAFDSEYDANRLFGAKHVPLLYTKETNGEYLAYNALPLLEVGNTQTVPVGVYDGATAGEFTLSFDGISTLNATVMLEDLKLNTMQQVIEGSTYNFTTEAGDSRDRFLLHFSADIATGITNIAGQESVRLFPNPTTGETNLLLNENHGFSTATIMDVSGRTVQHYELSANKNKQSLNTAELNNGIYFIQLTGSSNNQTLKLIKQ